MCLFFVVHLLLLFQILFIMKSSPYTSVTVTKLIAIFHRCDILIRLSYKPAVTFHYCVKLSEK